jgi:hypothetical protein
MNCLDVLTLPYSSLVSKVTAIVKLSFEPWSSMFSGTCHTYPQVPSQPKGMTPSATLWPSARVMSTVGLRGVRGGRDRPDVWE